MSRPACCTALVIAMVAATTAPARADDASDASDPFGLKKRPRPTAAPVAECTAEPLRWPCVIRAGDAPDAAPAAHRETLDRDHLWRLGRGNVRHDVAAAFARGAWVDLDGGVAFNGASTLEHRWMADGFPIDSVVDGSASNGGQTIPLAFIDTIDVLTGGLPSSSPASTGAVIDTHLRRGGATHQVDGSLWLGLAAPSRLAPGPRGDLPDAYEPLIFEEETTPGLRAAITAGGPLPIAALDRAWYFGGLSPFVDRVRLTRTARRLRDDDDDGSYQRDADGNLVLEVLDQRRRDFTVVDLPAIARAGLGVGAHDVELTLLGRWASQPRRDARGTVAATAVDIERLDGAAFATWTARWARTELRLTAGWARTHRSDHAHDPAAGALPQIGTAYLPGGGDAPEDGDLLLACADGVGGDEFPAVLNCPLPSSAYYLRGGVGLLFGVTTDRPAVSAEAVHRVAAAGVHRLAVGASAEDARYQLRRRYSGGYLERRFAENAVFVYQLVELSDTMDEGFADCSDDKFCRVLDADTQTYRTRQLAAYLEDTWEPADGLSVQAGLRWESHELGERIVFRDRLAPRLAVALDPTRRGRARLFASLARYQGRIPAGVGRDVIGDVDVLAITEFDDGSQGRVLYDEHGIAVDPAIELPSVDELAIGGDWMLADAVTVGALWRERTLRGGFENVEPPQGEPDGFPELITPGLGDETAAVRLTRTSRELQLWFGNAADAALHVRVGWVRSWQRGSWAGLFDADASDNMYFTGFDGLSGNAAGALPLDLPHRFFAEAVTGGRAWGLQLSAGGRLALQSGRPASTLAGDLGEVPLLPRGAAGRLPTTTTTTLHLAARRGAIEVGLDVLNLFGHQDAVALDQRWTLADTRPIEGGSDTDLVFAKTETGRPLPRHRGYLTPTRYQSPFVARLSLSARF